MVKNRLVHLQRFYIYLLTKTHLRMKKLLVSLVTLFALAMQSFVPVPGMTQVFLQVKYDRIGGMPRPSKGPGVNVEPAITAYLNEASDSLLLYSSSVDACSYNIYNDEEQGVESGSLMFSEQGEAAISIAALDEGIYSLSLEVDSLVYEGEFEKE